MDRQILTIFLASPGDLIEERKAVRETVDRLNKIIARRVNLTVELLGWEDTLPGYSRPQALINKDVDSCDLFIGLMWHRWGQDTGAYSSGFEEEFIRARDRRERTESPEIWLFFKKIDEKMNKDPGEQLKKVLKFRKEQEKNKELFFKEFGSLEEWYTIIYDNLLAYTLELKTEQKEAEIQTRSITLGKPKDQQVSLGDKTDKKKVSYPTELINIFKDTIKKINQGKKISLDIWGSLRLYLQSSTWFSLAHYGEIFENHEANLIYLKRKEWELSESEQTFLFRSSISDKYDRRPGWFWVKNLRMNIINGALLWYSLYDLNIEVQRGSIKLLSDIKIKFKHSFFEKILKNKDQEIILDSITLLRYTKNAEYIDLLDSLINDKRDEIKEAALSARIVLLYEKDPNEAFSYLIKYGSKVPSLIKRQLEEGNITFDSQLLFQALNEGDTEIRIFSAKYLRKANLLTKDKCEDLFKDPDANVRKEGLLAFIELGNEVEMDFVEKLFPKPKKQTTLLGGGLSSYGRIKSDDFIPYLYKRRSPEDLLLKIDFFSLNGDVAYKILALDYFTHISNRIRNDLDDEFESLIYESKSRLKDIYGESSSIISDKFDRNLVNYMKSLYLSAALEGLAKNGQEDDVKYARKYLTNKFLNNLYDGSIKLLAKYGNSSDVNKLIRGALKSYGSTQKLAIETAYKLSDKKGDLLKKLIEDKDTSISKAAVKILANSRIPNKIDFTKRLINFETDTIRLDGLAILYKQLNLKQLEQFLDEYISQESYYYDVVTWLDRCLYSKGLYRKFYHAKLSNRLL